jgi:hypothetical protein
MSKARRMKDVKGRPGKIRVEEIRISKPERGGVVLESIAWMKKGKDASCT